jgi:hypothetical protein
MTAVDEEFLTEKEIYRLKGVCAYEIHQNHGTFLSAFFQAFLVADPSNTRLLLPVMLALEKKYSLQDLARLDT